MHKTLLLFFRFILPFAISSSCFASTLNIAVQTSLKNADKAEKLVIDLEKVSVFYSHTDSITLVCDGIFYTLSMKGSPLTPESALDVVNRLRNSKAGSDEQMVSKEDLQWSKEVLSANDSDELKRQLALQALSLDAKSINCSSIRISLSPPHEVVTER
jgi:hypothetical protein